MIYILSITYIAYIIHIVNPTSVPKVDTTNSENHISEQDTNILNLMVSHYDCAKQNNLRQFSLLNAEPCKQAPSDILCCFKESLFKDSLRWLSPLF